MSLADDVVHVKLWKVIGSTFYDTRNELGYLSLKLECSQFFNCAVLEKWQY